MWRKSVTLFRSCDERSGLKAGSHTMKRPDYGIDAPGMVRNLIVAGTVALLLLLPATLGWWPRQPWGVSWRVCFCSARLISLVWAFLCSTPAALASSVSASICSTSFPGVGASAFSTLDAGMA